MPQAVDLLVEKLGHFSGVKGCALIEVDTGMAWHCAGAIPGIEKIGEVAIEFWRVHTRLSAHFDQFGAFNSSAHSFANQVIALFPCSKEPALVLVCVADKSGVDWAQWGKGVNELKLALANKSNLN